MTMISIFSTQVDLLTDIAHSPRILTNFASAIQPASFKKVQFNDLNLQNKCEYVGSITNVLFLVR